MPQSKTIPIKFFGLLIVLSVGLVVLALKAFPDHTTAILLTDIALLIGGLFSYGLLNLSRRKVAEKSRLELEQSLGILVRHIKDYAIFLVDPEGRVLSWNKGAEQIKGYTDNEIIGKPISVFYSEEDNRNGEPFLNLERAAKEGRYESLGLRKRKDGTLFHADVVLTPLYDDKNNIRAFIKITRDITDRKKAEDDIQIALQREKELNEMKSRFVTLASHEFKTPLSVILSSTVLIEKYPDTDMQDKRLKHTHRIKSNVNNLKQILNDFLSLEKLEGGIIQNCPVPTDPGAFTHEIIQEMEEALKEGQKIVLHTHGHPRPINVDPLLLRNVINNLLSNAIKYSPEQTTIDVTLSYEPETIRLGVHDQGIGIPPEEQEHLFERFFRATNTAGISGTGLGLSIVKRYLDLMRGHIHLSSAPGGGSTFTVTLPG